jgi:hypothetical protein
MGYHDYGEEWGEIKPPSASMGIDVLVAPESGDWLLLSAFHYPARKDFSPLLSGSPDPFAAGLSITYWQWLRDSLSVSLKGERILQSDRTVEKGFPGPDRDAHQFSIMFNFNY